MLIRETYGMPLTHETLIPGNTPTGISDGVKYIRDTYYRTTGTDLVSNGTFETDTTGWTAVDATLAKVTDNRTNSAGTGALRITATDALGHGYQDLTTVAGTRYRLRFYYKNTAGDLAQYRVTNDRTGTEADIKAAADLTSSTDWSTYQDIFFTALGTLTTVYLRAKTNTDIVWFDDVSVLAIEEYGERQGDEDSISNSQTENVKNKLGRHAITALIMGEDQTLRFTVDGSTPTNSTAAEPDHGFELSAASNKVLTWHELNQLKVVDAVSGTNGKLQVTCYF